VSNNKPIQIPASDHDAIKAILSRLHVNIGPWAGQVLKREAERLSATVEGMNEKRLITVVKCGDDYAYFESHSQAKLFCDAAAEAENADEYDSACNEYARGHCKWGKPEAVECWGSNAVENSRQLTAF